MTLTDALARINEIRGLADPQASTSASAPPSTASSAATAASFQALLDASSDDGSDSADSDATGLSASSLLSSALGTSGTAGGAATLDPTGTLSALSSTGALDPTGTLGSLGSSGALGALAVPVTGGATGPAAPTAAQRMVAVAEGEVGQSEQPPGSNDSPRIAQYRTATSGAGVGPWCAYFASWAASQAGTPLGEAGQGFGSVDAVTGWAQRTGRWIPAGTATPQAGDLITWGSHHIGIVESVDPNGSIHTIEGNSSNAVTRHTYGPDGNGATGFVRVS